MIGFARDDQPRANEAVRLESGLWVAGAEYVERMDREKGEPEGGVYAATSLAPTFYEPWGHIRKRVDA